MGMHMHRRRVEKAEGDRRWPVSQPSPLETSKQQVVKIKWARNQSMLCQWFAPLGIDLRRVEPVARWKWSVATLTK